MKNKIDNIKVIYPYFKNRSIETFDTASINWSEQYNILQALYTPLIQKASDGKIVGGVSNKFYWDGDKVTFEFNSNFKSSQGDALGAEDAYLSLKRQMVLGSSTHVSLDNFLCPNTKINSLDDKCDGLQLEGNKLILTPVKRLKKFLFETLTSVDFSVIPKNNINKENLKLLGHYNTSGAYFVKQSDSSGRVVLQHNPNSCNYSNLIAKEIELIPSIAPNDDVFKRFLDGEIDVIPPFMWPDSFNRLNEFLEKNDVNVHQSMNILLHYLKFTDKGQKELSSKRRHSIGLKMKQAYLENVDHGPRLVETDVYFGVYGEGHLDKEQHAELKKIQGTIDLKNELGQGVILGVPKTMVKFYEKLFRKNLPKLIIKPLSGHPVFSALKQNEMPHMFFQQTDSSFKESINQLGYMITIKDIPLSIGDSERWLKNYMGIGDKTDRLKELRQLHFEMLSSPSVIPFAVSPYYAVSRKPWEITASTLYAGLPFWKIVRSDE